MSEVIGVRFKKVGKVYYFDPCGEKVAAGQNVVVETARGIEYGETVLDNREVDDEELVKPLKKLIRVATEEDAQVVEENNRKAKEAFTICEKKIADHKLEMKLVAVEYTFDLNKVLFYFTADGRVDFRELVKDLAAVFRTRIELRQIGVRDEAKMLGGLGVCGRPLCCSSFLDDFQPVSINMAKEQNLSLNPTKISGTCGRLMCCLKYEHEVYEELSKVTPRPDSLVNTPEGRGTVVDASMLRGTCRVRLEATPETPKCYACSECHVLRGPKSRRGQDMAEGEALETEEKRPREVQGDRPRYPEKREGRQERPQREDRRRTERRHQDERPRHRQGDRRIPGKPGQGESVPQQEQ